MFAVHFVSARRYRVLAPETMTLDAPEDLERRGGSAVEKNGGTLEYETREGRSGSISIDARKKLAFRKEGDFCLIRSEDLSPDGYAIWQLARVERRV